jgi:hypothetical protein
MANFLSTETSAPVLIVRSIVWQSPSVETPVPALIVRPIVWQSPSVETPAVPITEFGRVANVRGLYRAALATGGAEDVASSGGGTGTGVIIPTSGQIFPHPSYGR